MLQAIANEELELAQWLCVSFWVDQKGESFILPCLRTAYLEIVVKHLWSYGYSLLNGCVCGFVPVESPKNVSGRELSAIFTVTLN